MNRFIRYAGPFEVLTVFFAGSMLAGVLYQLAGITGHPLAALSADNPDMFAIGIQTGKVLLLQYTGFLLLAAIFTLVQRRHLLRDRGITFSGYRLGTLLVIGVVAWAAGDLLNKVLMILDTELDLGTAVPWREALLNAEQSPGWWFLMAIGSFGLVPILEEVFWRGYVQSRLNESMSAGAAILLTAVMFTLSHTQYHHADVYHISTIVGVFISSLVLGWVFHFTRSLVPVIVMHAMLNFPVFGVWAYLVAAVMLATMLLSRHALRCQCNRFIETVKAHRFFLSDGMVLLLLAYAMLAISQWPAHIQGITLISVLVSVTACIWFIAGSKDGEKIQTSRQQ